MVFAYLLRPKFQHPILNFFFSPSIARELRSSPDHHQLETANAQGEEGSK
jgi:hypothetical protein